MTPPHPSLPGAWLVGRSVYQHGQLPGLLYRSGMVHARRAVSLYAAEGMDDQLLGAISVGCAMELLTKALIAETEPALLAERGPNRDSLRDTLLHLTGKGRLAAIAPSDVRTLSGPDAVAIAARLHPELPWRPQADQVVFSVRNSAAHKGLVDRRQLEEAVRTMLRYISAALPLLSRGHEEFWTADLAPLASTLADEANDRTRQLAAIKLTAARQRLQRMVEPLDRVTRASILAALSGRTMPTGRSEYQQPQTCPICDQQGWLLCTVERSDVQWTDDGAPYVDRVAHPFAFRCPVCGLELEGGEMDGQGFPHLILEPEPEPEPGPAEAPDYERDEVWLRGR